MFRKKPIEIEARWFQHPEDASVLCTWCGGTNEVRPVEIQIPTMEGIMTASIGDWIIKGVKGEFYPCKRDIFAAIYDLVEESVEPSRASHYS